MDKYDEQIEELTENPKQIRKQWVAGKGLFQFCSKSGENDFDKCGCLTMIAHGTYREAETENLTKAIRADKARIPAHSRAITLESLPIFAEWQRRIDKELGRTC